MPLYLILFNSNKDKIENMANIYLKYLKDDQTIKTTIFKAKLIKFYSAIHHSYQYNFKMLWAINWS